MVPRLLAWCCLLGALGSTTLSATDESRTRRVYVTASDDAGSVVPDLQASDFIVKEDGKSRDIVDARAASEQMHIAVIVDDNGTGIFRAGLARFVERLQARAEFALTVVVPQPQKLLDFTTDMQRLSETIRNLNARPGTPDGGQLLEGIYESAKEISRRELSRPMIVVLTVGGEEHSSRSARNVLDELQQSGAALHVFMIVSSALRSTVAVSRPSALLEENHTLSQVLGDGPKQSGGHHEEIVATTGIVSGLQRLAEELLHQYVITYSLPDGVKASSKIGVSVSRPGVSLRAPTRISDRGER
jgi:VWFA-related protein